MQTISSSVWYLKISNLPKTIMRAILHQTGSETLRLGEHPAPDPGPSDLLIKVAATALNRADIMQRKGNYPPPAGASPILGLEVAGTVAAVGDEVNSWELGDRVCGLLAGGGYAEYAVLHEDMALPVPEQMDWTVAGAIPETFLTAYQALFTIAGLREGERVLLHAGASGVGTAAIQLARLAGAEVLVTASAPKHDLCRKLGASQTIDYRQEDFAEAIAEYTTNKGVDVIVDVIGVPYFRQNIDALATDGRMVLLAFMGGHRIPDASLIPVLMKRLTITGSTLRARPLSYKIKLTQDFRAFAWQAIIDGKVAPVIDSVFDWTEAEQAHQRMEANANAGKIVLRVTE